MSFTGQQAPSRGDERQTRMRHLAAAMAIIAAAAALQSCGGGGTAAPAPTPTPTPTPPPPPPPPPAVRLASGDSPIAAGCTGLLTGSPTGTNFANAEVEPFAAINPGNANLMLAAWQQDRWSDGGARAVMSAVSSDGGASWTRFLHPFSRCAGGSSANGGDYERATDPWVDIAADGTMHMMALAFSGASFAPGSSSAVLASRSSDGGRTWSPAATLVLDGANLFNDKPALTVDALDAHFVYVVWDRLDTGDNGPSLLARSSDGGQTWEAARIFYTPRTPTGAGSSQTIGNRIVVPTAGAARGMLVNLFAQIDTVGGTSSSHLAIVRSADRGLTWGAPVTIAQQLGIGARDPDTGQAIRDGSDVPQIAAGPDGTLWVVWQDARFSGGQRDAIALSRSSDGGLTWSTPVAVNRVATTPAFTPSITVRADGLVAITHYDLRNNTSDPTTLPADAWLLTSRDGVGWNETRISSASFDLALAPRATGAPFLGDYQGLVAAGSSVMPVLVMANGTTANRTDVFTPRFDGVTNALAFSARGSVPALDADQRAALAHAHSAAIVAARSKRLSR